MVPKIVSKGRSFKGAAQYLLHDKDRADTSERVDWVETRNLATDDPELAWRLMAVTAMDQARLKQAAGVRNTGRKSDQSVLHMVLSWHPDEAEGLSRDEMRRAAVGALSAIGADDRQTMLVAHNDEEHAHLHLLCNRVSHEDGRMLPSSKDHLKLSKWAQSYEMERGQIFCENRVVNNERRARGEFVADESARPYHQAAEAKTHTPEQSSRALDALRASQRAQDRLLVERGAQLAETHKEQWAALSERFGSERAAIKDRTRTQTASARSEVGQRYHPLRLDQNRRHADERNAFEEREQRFSGKLTNAIQALDHVRAMRGEEGSGALTQGFRVLASSGARRGALQQAHDAEKKKLDRQETAEFQAARRGIMASAQSDRAKLQAEYQSRRLLLIDRQAHENEALKRAWRTRTEERAAAFHAYAKGQALPYGVSDDFEHAAHNERSKPDKGDSGGMDAVLDELDDLYNAEPSNRGSEHDDDYEY